MSKEKIYELKITLLDSKPSIWRKIHVSSDSLLPDLHNIIQTSMGWTNSHLHQFIDKGTFYAAPDPWGEMDNKDYQKIQIDHILKKEKDKTLYEYDFGDGWRHEILLEKILEKGENEKYPVCVDGKNACPPEDCGGIWGYMDMKEIMRNPKHKEYEEMKEWLGGELNPKAFDKNEVNEMLQSEDYGVITFFD